MMTDPVREVRERQARERERQIEQDIQAVLENAAGRRLLMAMLAKGRVWSTTGADGDAVRMAYTCGRRDGAVAVLAAANRYSQGMVALAMAENNARVAQWNEEITTAMQLRARRERE